MIYHVRQRQTYYQDFKVEYAESPEEAIDLVSQGSVSPSSDPQYLAAVGIYLLDDEGRKAADKQPTNAMVPLGGV
jgi:hypothetical protein